MSVEIGRQIPGYGYCWSKGRNGQCVYLWRTAMLGYHGVPNSLGIVPSGGKSRMDLIASFMGLERRES